MCSQTFSLQESRCPAPLRLFWLRFSLDSFCSVTWEDEEWLSASRFLPLWLAFLSDVTRAVQGMSRGWQRQHLRALGAPSSDTLEFRQCSVLLVWSSHPWALGCPPPRVATLAWLQVIARQLQIRQAPKESSSQHSARLPRRYISFTETEAPGTSFSNALWQEPHCRAVLAWGWSGGPQNLPNPLTPSQPHPQAHQRHKCKPRGSRNEIWKQCLDLCCSF